MRIKKFKDTERAEQWLQKHNYERISEWVALWGKSTTIASVWFNQKSKYQFALLISVEEEDGFAQVYY